MLFFSTGSSSACSIMAIASAKHGSIWRLDMFMGMAPMALLVDGDGRKRTLEYIRTTSTVYWLHILLYSVIILDSYSVLQDFVVYLRV